MNNFDDFLKNTVELKQVQGGRKKLIDSKFCDGNTVNVYEHTFLGIHTGTSSETVSNDAYRG